MKLMVPAAVKIWLQANTARINVALVMTQPSRQVQSLIQNVAKEWVSATSLQEGASVPLVPVVVSTVKPCALEHASMRTVRQIVRHNLQMVETKLVCVIVSVACACVIQRRYTMDQLVKHLVVV
jgi:hypothetical protein